MDQPLVDRRRDARLGALALAGTQAILRPGCAVALIDLSAGGALIEGPRPVGPGKRVHLQIVTATRKVAIAAHVLRCAVSSLDLQHGVRYRGALEFDHRCDVLWEGNTPDGYAIPLQGLAAPERDGDRLPGGLGGPRAHDERQKE